MASHTTSHNGSVPPTDVDYNYGAPYPPYGLKGNFNYPPKGMASDNNQQNAMNGIFMLATFVFFLFVICIYAGLRRREHRGISLSRRSNINWRRGFSFAREDLPQWFPWFARDRISARLRVQSAELQRRARMRSLFVGIRGERESPASAQLQTQLSRRMHRYVVSFTFNLPDLQNGRSAETEVREIHIGPGLEQGETSSQEAKSAVDEGPSTSEISSMPETAIDMAGRPESEKQMYLQNGSQSSRTALHSLKRILSRGREGRVFPDAPRDHRIESEGQSQS